MKYTIISFCSKRRWMLEMLFITQTDQFCLLKYNDGIVLYKYTILNMRKQFHWVMLSSLSTLTVEKHCNISIKMLFYKSSSFLNDYIVTNSSTDVKSICRCTSTISFIAIDYSCSIKTSKKAGLWKTAIHCDILCIIYWGWLPTILQSAKYGVKFSCFFWKIMIWIIRKQSLKEKLINGYYRCESFKSNGTFNNVSCMFG